MKAVAKWGDNPSKLVDGITAEAGSKAMKALETGGKANFNDVSLCYWTTIDEANGITTLNDLVEFMICLINLIRIG